jgi:hypothetical protein
MIRHVAVFKFKPEFTDEQLDTWIAMVEDLPNHIPQVKGLSIGRDQLHGPNSHQLAIVADFDSLEDLAVYSTHPAHQPVLDMSAPVKDSLAVVDFEI